MRFGGRHELGYTNGESKPVVAIDIDGTLGNYHGNFIQFARLYFGAAEEVWSDDNPGMPMWEWMGIPLRTYRDAKLAYRQGGWKRWMPVYPGASELTHEIRSAGAEVWLCTTRPYLRLDNIDPDTREWIRRNNIAFDALLFDPVHEEDGGKYGELVRQVGDRIAAVVDDLPEMIEEARRLSIPAYQRPILRDQPYNAWYKPSDVIRAIDLSDVRSLVFSQLEEWYGRQA
jgi:hypothetical protein